MGAAGLSAVSRSAKADANPEFETFWRRTVHDGVMANTALPTRTIAAAASIAAFGVAPAPPATGIEISFRTDPSVHDGRFNNNAWLQELPKPLTHLTWDNAILVSPATMRRLGGTATPGFTGGERGQIHAPVVEVRYRGRSVRGAMFAVAGHPDGAATLHLGYGRSRTGRIGANRGFNAGALRTSDALSFGTGAQISLTGERMPLACVQYHHLMEGRDIIRTVARSELASLKHEERELPSLWPVLTDEQAKAGGYKWGMSIDLNACIGLQCVRGVLSGREQHSGGWENGGDARTRDALAPRGQLSPGRRRESRRPTFSPCRACIAKRRHASPCAPSAQRLTAARG